MGELECILTAADSIYVSNAAGEIGKIKFDGTITWEKKYRRNIRALVLDPTGAILVAVSHNNNAEVVTKFNAGNGQILA